MDKKKFFIVSLFLMFFCLGGCTSPTVQSPPYTTSQFVSQSTNLDLNVFNSGGYIGLLGIQGSKFGFVGLDDLNIPDLNNIDFSNYVSYSDVNSVNLKNIFTDRLNISDKVTSNIVNLGDNLCLNGSFDNNSDGWVYDSDWSYDAINKRMIHAVNGIGTLSYEFEVMEGKNYIITVDINVTNRIMTGSVVGVKSFPLLNSSKKYNLEFIPDSSGLVVLQFKSNSNNGRYSIDNIIIQEMLEINSNVVKLTNGIQDIEIGAGVTSGDSSIGINWVNSEYPNRNIGQNVINTANLMNFGVNSPNVGGGDVTNPTGVQFQLDARGRYGIFKIYQQLFDNGDWSEFEPFSVGDYGNVKVGYGWTEPAVLSVKGGGGEDEGQPQQDDMVIFRAVTWDGSKEFVLNEGGDLVTGGSIQADGYKSSDGTAGLTSSSFYMCKDASCSNKCNVIIKNGLITGCV